MLETETRWGLLPCPSEKDGGLDQGGSGGTSKKGSDSGYFLTIESTGFLCCLFIKRVQEFWPERLEQWIVTRWGKSGFGGGN